MMRLLPALALLGLLPSAAYAETVDYPALAGSSYRMANEVGIGSILTSTFWTDPETTTLDQFTLWLVDGSSDLTYRTGVGAINLDGRWAGGIYESDWQTVTPTGTAHAITTTVGLSLDPSLYYLLYVQPQTPGDWRIQTSGANLYRSIVGAEVYSPHDLVDWDLAFDQDVALSVTMSQVPEPSTLWLLGVGLLAVWVRR